MELNVNGQFKIPIVLSIISNSQSRQSILTLLDLLMKCKKVVNFILSNELKFNSSYRGKKIFGIPLCTFFCLLYKLFDYFLYFICFNISTSLFFSHL